MKNNRGFTLMELVIVVAIIGILATIALPSYNGYVVRASREAAQTEMLQMAALQEKIYLNSSSYSVAANVISDVYTGQAAGGLGNNTATSVDRKYTYTCAPCGAQSFTLNATPVATSTQKNDGTLLVDSTGLRQWTKNGVNKPW